MKDEDMLCDVNGSIYDLVYRAIQALTDGDAPEWDMGLIAETTDAITDVMEQHGIPVCYPWEDEEGNICYSDDDERCSHCTRIQSM